MRRAIFRRCQRAADRLFPERQIILRSRGEVRYVALSRAAQVMASAAMLTALVLGGAGVIDTVLHHRAREQRVADILQAYDQLAADFQRTQERFTLASRELEDKYRRLHDLASQHGTLQQNLSVTEDRLNRVARERDQALQTREKLQSRISTLEQQLAGLRGTQDELIERINDRARSNLSMLERAIRMTGVDSDRLLARALEDLEIDGEGGPLVAVPDAEASPAAGDPDSKLAGLEAQLARWTGLQAVVQRMPLARPVDGGSVSSGFGKRRDPITRQMARHNGVDITGAWKSPIRATGPGTVVFAGRKGPYGRMVEIDHGYGFKTRYGHLRQLQVKRGDEVGTGHIIGIMGSTGRSTGVHLHYEVLYNDEPQNPVSFLEAGTHVPRLEEVDAANR